VPGFHARARQILLTVWGTTCLTYQVRLIGDGVHRAVRAFFSLNQMFWGLRKPSLSSMTARSSDILIQSERASSY
jgi:hypothetical protein